jgi:hypothetical protein
VEKPSVAGKVPGVATVAMIESNNTVAGSVEERDKNLNQREWNPTY